MKGLAIFLGFLLCWGWLGLAIYEGFTIPEMQKDIFSKKCVRIITAQGKELNCDQAKNFKKFFVTMVHMEEDL